MQSQVVVLFHLTHEAQLASGKKLVNQFVRAVESSGEIEAQKVSGKLVTASIERRWPDGSVDVWVEPFGSRP